MFKITQISIKATTLGRKAVNNVAKGKINPQKFSEQLDTFYKNAIDIAPAQKNWFKKVKAWFSTFANNYRKAKAEIKQNVEEVKNYHLHNSYIDKISSKDDKKLTKITKKFVTELLSLEYKKIKNEIKILKKNKN